MFYVQATSNPASEAYRRALTLIQLPGNRTRASPKLVQACEAGLLRTRLVEGVVRLGTLPPEEDDEDRLNP
jgi:hypothetical protein